MLCNLQSISNYYTGNYLKLNHIGCSRAFGTIYNFKTDGSTFVKRFVPAGLDCGIMDENIRSTILFNETKSLRRVKPFYDTLFHFVLLLAWGSFLGTC